MSTPRDLEVAFQRITWRDGQLLASRDLRDDLRYSDRLRHLHIRYQHKTWGVVEGLEVTAVGASGVAVNPGYALDIEGRDLLLPVLARVATPADIAASTTMYLVISQSAGSTTCAAPPDLATLCPGIRKPIPIEEGRLSWKTVTQVRLGYDVLLARALIASGILASPVDTSVQRRAATMAQQRIWSDVTQPGSTGWTDGSQLWELDIQATIDTSDAGFVATPAYFARLAGTSEGGITFISSASATSFTFVIYPYQPGGAAPKAAAAESAGWTIAWFAVELLPVSLLFPFP